MNVIEAINNRRTVRRFMDKDVHDDIIMKLLDAARMSPSGGNGQNWMFGIVRDKNRIKELAKAAGNQTWIEAAPVVITLCTNIDYDRNDLPADDFGLIVDQTRFGKNFVEYLNQYEDRHMTNIFWNNANVLIPGEHILLAGQEYGIYGCFVGYLDLLKSNQILDLPKEWTCLYLLPIGYPKHVDMDEDKKKLENLYFTETWRKENGNN